MYINTELPTSFLNSIDHQINLKVLIESLEFSTVSNPKGTQKYQSLGNSGFCEGNRKSRRFISPLQVAYYLLRVPMQNNERTKLYAYCTYYKLLYYNP